MTRATSRVLPGVLLMTVLFVLAAPASAAAPRTWLPTEGKGESWIKGTARIRNLLTKLRTDNPVVRKWLPTVRWRCETLRRLDNIGGREKATFTDIFETMLQDLVNGEPPFRRYAGQTIPYGYWSTHMGRLTGIRLQVPPGYDPSREYQFFMYYKLGGGLYWKKDGKFVRPETPGAKLLPPYRPTAAMCGNTPGTFHGWSSLYYGLKGRMGVSVELLEVILALTRDFSISPDRVFLSGFSDGGFTALWLGSRYPHLVAGIAPEVANWQYSNVNQIGLYNVALLVVDGWSDGGFVGENFARFHALHTMGYDVAALFGHHGHQTLPYEDKETFTKIMSWARTKRRNPNPKRVRYATWDLNWHRAFWFSIERMAEPSLAALVDAQIKDGNRIEVKAKNIAAYKLLLNDKLVDPTKPVVVVTNGKECYSGPFKAELAVEVVKLPESKFVKSPRIPGGITATMTHHTYNTRGYLAVPGQRWMWVRPTGGTGAERSVLAKFVPKFAVDDTKITPEHLQTRNLFIYGGPGLNKLTDKIAGDLPVRFEKGRFRIGNKVYDKPRHCVKFIHPSPFNPKKYIMIFGFNDVAAAAKANFGRAGAGFFRASSWGFRAGDCQVYGIEPPRRDFGLAIRSRRDADYYVFNANWRAPDQTILGTVTETFDLTALQRLKADAIREATGADAAIAWGYPPGYNRWKNYLKRGPVTLSDVAVTQMLPEYAMLCEVTGARLKAFVSQSLAGTVLRHKSDPAYDPKTSLLFSQIDDKKTYTMATDYSACSSGRLTYGINLRKMPKLFYFKSPLEFAAHKAASLPCSRLRQSDVELAEAIARYVRKRGKVSPRPTTTELNHYIVSPKVNEFGAYDWVHLSLPASFKDPKTGRAVGRRETFNLGLQVTGGPATAPPRKNSKTFKVLDTNEPNAACRVEMKTLDKRLPVTVVVKIERFGVTGPPFKLARAEKATAGTAAFVKVSVVNSGNKELSGVAVLGASSIRRFHGGYWPDSVKRGDPAPYYRGFVDSRGPRKAQYHTNAIFMLARSGGLAVSRLLLPNAGYNMGTIGIRRNITVGPNSTLDLPLLLIGVNAPDPGKPQLPDLGKVLKGIRPALMKALK